jgi:hypothetical protein
MHLKLPTDYVDPKTQTPLPDAVLVVADCEFALRRGDTRVMAAVYVNPSVIGFASPMSEYPIALGPEERDAQLPSLLMALYSAIAARPEYEGSALVP